jgi:hypothetical protein
MIRKIETIVLNTESNDFATIHKNAGEYSVKFYNSGIHAIEADYFTNDLHDAQGTAKSQAWAYINGKRTTVKV